ncbi:MAG TPA: MFS transporter [Solirubrobacteraceae bacterium]|nr:MFS transporter [Solirubrobacteraceae bacterium]
MTCPSSVGADRSSKAGRRPRFLAPLARRDFALLWVGTGLSLAGDGIYAVALAWQVYELSGAASALAAVGLAWTLPQLAFLPWAGIVADRHDRRRLLIAADLVRAAAIGTLGLLSVLGALELWMVAALVVAYGVAEAFAAPAFIALVPQVVAREELVAANALEQSVRPLALRLAGPAAGGLLVALVGAGGALLVDAATFAACAVAIGLMRVARVPAASAARVWRAELAEGVRYVRERAWLWSTLAAAAIGLLGFYGPVTVLLPWVVKHELGAGAGALGLILAAGGAGALAAALAVGQLGLPGPPLRTVYVSWAVGALAIAGWGLAGSVGEAVAVSVVVHGAMTVGAIAWGALLQRAVPERLLGRVSSLDWLASTALIPVSLALTAPAAALLGPRDVLVGAGLASGSALALLGLAAAVRDRRLVRANWRAMINRS